jgi:hypothetical protein
MQALTHSNPKKDDPRVVEALELSPARLLCARDASESLPFERVPEGTLIEELFALANAEGDAYMPVDAEELAIINHILQVDLENVYVLDSPEMRRLPAFPLVAKQRQVVQMAEVDAEIERRRSAHVDARRDPVARLQEALQRVEDKGTNPLSPTEARDQEYDAGD